MAKLIKMLFTLALVTTPVHALDNISQLVPDGKEVGKGRLTYMLWDVYDATLYAPQGKWQENKPFALKLSYLRKISGKQIADRSVEEMRDLGISDEVKLATWHTQMRRIFPDVDKGISLTGVATQTGETIFYENQTEIGRIIDPKFSKAFFGIWLNDNTNVPDLRRKLLGSV